ncbi:unnamed protein product [Schistosoma curassoni]|uniref:Transposase n=1 Tax=Schistosoma curassoni TaxID=6186 RepID=A0A183JIC7_9TREM|nr:unnamed protein product [Schistosoma curassoni]
MSLNFVDYLKLVINTVGCQLSDLMVKRSRARPINPRFESRKTAVQCFQVFYSGLASIDS